MRLTILILATVAILSLGWAWKLQDSNLIDTYTFSNTSNWNPLFLDWSSRKVESIPNWEELINIPPPSTNSSAETREELAKLVSHKELRTAEKIAQIENELDIASTEFGGRPMDDYFNFDKYPYTAELFTNSFKDITTIVLSLKKKYDRVRPHVLEPDIMPIIDVPKHPAYPSGHSTQAHFMAYLLGEIFPEDRSEFLSEARRIAQNREIAGVHYESDSEAGRLLARQFVDLLIIKPEIKKLIPLAHKELSK